MKTTQIKQIIFTFLLNLIMTIGLITTMSLTVSAATNPTCEVYQTWITDDRVTVLGRLNAYGNYSYPSEMEVCIRSENKVNGEYPFIKYMQIRGPIYKSDDLKKWGSQDYYIFETITLPNSGRYVVNVGVRINGIMIYGNSKTYSITKPAYAKPTISSPSNGKQYTEGDIVPMQANITGSGYSYTKFYVKTSTTSSSHVYGTLNGKTGSTPSDSWNTSGATPGTYYIYAVLYDSQGNIIDNKQYIRVTLIAHKPSADTISITGIISENIVVTVPKGCEFKFPAVSINSSSSNLTAVTVYIDNTSIRKSSENKNITLSGKTASLNGLKLETQNSPVGTYKVRIWAKNSGNPNPQEPLHTFTIKIVDVSLDLVSGIGHSNYSISQGNTLRLNSGAVRSDGKITRVWLDIVNSTNNSVGVSTALENLNGNYISIEGATFNTKNIVQGKYEVVVWVRIDSGVSGIEPTSVRLPLQIPITVTPPAGNGIIRPIKVSSTPPLIDGREFGATRQNGRFHAGIDFVCSAGTPVYASQSGTVIFVDNNNFYAGTGEIQVKNDDGTILRYGEIAPEVKNGQRVNQGDRIAAVKKHNGTGYAMLHLEYYKGDGVGSLTNTSNKNYTYVTQRNYQRRSDLLDSTKFFSAPINSDNSAILFSITVDDIEDDTMKLWQTDEGCIELEDDLTVDIPTIYIHPPLIVNDTPTPVTTTAENFTWFVHDGSWQLNGNQGSVSGGHSVAFLEEPIYGDFTFSATFRLENTGGWSDSGIFWASNNKNFDHATSQYIGMYCVDGYVRNWGNVSGEVNFSINQHEWYTVTVSISEKITRIYINNNLIFEYFDENTPAIHYVGLRSYYNPCEVKNISIKSNKQN